MNTPNQHLWELIKSLSPAEKRYYKTHFGSGENQHTALFNLLNEQNEPDDDVARNGLFVSAAVFKVVKAQLYDGVIKSLIAQKGKRNLKSSIRLGLEEVDLLLEREHYNVATKKLKTLAKKCSQFGMTLYQYEIAERLHEIQHLELDFSDPNALQYYKDLVFYQAILTQKQILSSIQLKIEAWSRFMPMRHKAISEIIEQLFKMRAEYLDVSSMLNWFQNLATCYELQNKTVEALNMRQQILSFFETNKRFQKELPSSYLNALKQASNLGLELPDLVKMDNLYLKAEKIIAFYPQHAPHFIYFLWAKLQARYRHYEWDYITAVLDAKCMSYIQKYQLEDIKTSVKIIVVLATTHLIKGHFSRAQELIELFKTNKSTKEQSLIYNVNILELCLYWEQEELEKLVQLTGRFKRQLKQNEIHFSSIYTIHLDLFSVIAKEPYLLPEKASETLLRIAEAPFDPLLHYYSLFNLERWIQAAAVRKQWREIFVVRKPT